MPAAILTSESVPQEAQAHFLKCMFVTVGITQFLRSRSCKLPLGLPNMCASRSHVTAGTQSPRVQQLMVVVASGQELISANCIFFLVEIRVSWVHNDFLRRPLCRCPFPERQVAIHLQIQDCRRLCYRHGICFEKHDCARLDQWLAACLQMLFVD